MDEKKERNEQIYRRWKAGEPLKAIARDVGVSPQRVRDILLRIENELSRQARPSLSARALTVLSLRHTRSVDEITPERVAEEFSESFLRDQPNCGNSTIREVKDWLASFGLSLKP